MNGLARGCAAGVAALLLACGGTGRLETDVEQLPTRTGTAGKQAEVDGELGRIAPASVATGALRTRAGELATCGRHASLGVLVSRHPDVALEALRQAAGEEATPGDLALAARYHRLTGVDWRPVFAALAREPEARTRYSSSRAELISRLGRGSFSAALAVETGSGLPAPLAADIARLHTLAALAAGDLPAAVRATAIGLSRTADPQERAELRTLAAVAARRGGDAAKADAAWSDAVAAARDLARRGVGVPRIWERLSYLRPHRRDWPRDAVAALSRVLPAALAQALGSRKSGAIPNTESIVLAAVGILRERRGEPGAALLALKRAEGVIRGGGDPRLAASLIRWYQARALAQLGQRGPATSLLLALQKQEGARRPALATLGAMALGDGQVGRARGLLTRAADGGDWPGSAQATADLGLAHLLSGDEAGLTHLERAARRFRAAGDTEQLILCLQNRLAWHEDRRETVRAAALGDQLARLERAGD